MLRQARIDASKACGLSRTDPVEGFGVPSGPIAIRPIVVQPLRLDSPPVPVEWLNLKLRLGLTL